MIWHVWQEANRENEGEPRQRAQTEAPAQLRTLAMRWVSDEEQGTPSDVCNGGAWYVDARRTGRRQHWAPRTVPVTRP